MAVVASDVTSRAKEFASLQAGEITLAIADASLQVNRDVWGTKADLATIFLAAHILSVQNPALATSAGPVQTEKVGEISRTYAVSPLALGHLATYLSTKWGREYVRLLRQMPSAVVA